MHVIKFITGHTGRAGHESDKSQRISHDNSEQVETIYAKDQSQLAMTSYASSELFSKSHDESCWVNTSQIKEVITILDKSDN